MTDFKLGDRVQYNAIDGHAVRQHNELGTLTAVGDMSQGVSVRWDNGDLTTNSRNYLVPVAPKLTKLFSQPSPFAPEPRPLVGPAPTPPAAPRYVAPFSYRGGTIFQANGEAAFDIDLRAFNANNTDIDELGEYIASALNASVFNEE